MTSTSSVRIFPLEWRISRMSLMLPGETSWLFMEVPVNNPDQFTVMSRNLWESISVIRETLIAVNVNPALLLAQLGHQERREKLDLEDFQDQTERTERMELQESLFLSPTTFQVDASSAQPDHVDHAEMPDHQDHQETEDVQDNVEFQEKPEPQDQSESQETTDHKDHKEDQDNVERLDNQELFTLQETQDVQDHKDHVDHKESQERMDPREIQERKDVKDIQERMEELVLMERTELQESVERKDQLDQTPDTVNAHPAPINLYIVLIYSNNEYSHQKFLLIQFSQGSHVT